MSWPGRSLGGKSGHTTRTPSPPSSRSLSPARAAPSSRATASGSGSSSGPDMKGSSHQAVIDLDMMMRRFPARCPDIPRHNAIGSTMWALRRRAPMALGAASPLALGAASPLALGAASPLALGAASPLALGPQRPPLLALGGRGLERLWPAGSLGQFRPPGYSTSAPDLW